METKDVIIIPNFWDENEHLYSNMLGWQPRNIKDAHSLVSKVIFESLIVDCCLNLAFYYIDNDTFYGLHRELYPIELKVLPRDKTAPFIAWQCDGDTHDDGEVVCSFDDEHDLWDGIKIDGKSLEEVLERSYIITIN